MIHYLQDFSLIAILGVFTRTKIVQVELDSNCGSLSYGEELVVFCSPSDYRKEFMNAMAEQSKAVYLSNEQPGCGSSCGRWSQTSCRSCHTQIFSLCRETRRRGLASWLSGPILQNCFCCTTLTTTFNTYYVAWCMNWGPLLLELSNIFLSKINFHRIG